MKKKTPLSADAAPDPWREKLLGSLKQERPSPRRWGLWLGLGFVVVMGLLTWWLYPRPAPALPPLVAFDALIPTGADAPVRAVFELPEQGQPIPRFEGRSFRFQESRLPLGQELSSAQVALDKEGVARASLKVPAALGQVAYEAHCPAGKDLHAGIKDQAHIFSVPAGSKLLLVSIDETLSLAVPEEWQKANPRDIVAVPEAPPALHAARKLGYQVVYLALGPDRPTIYQKMRGWARFRFGAHAGALPEGPVLGRLQYPGESGAAHTGLLADLKERFPAEHATVTSSPMLAKCFQAAGYRTIVIGDGEPMAGIERLRGWSELSRALQ